MARKTDLAKLVVRMEAENARLHRQLGNSEQRMGKTRKRFRKELTQIGKRFLAMAGVAGAALTAIFVKSAQGIDNLAKTSDKLGIPTEKLQALRFAAQLTGIDVRQLDLGIQRMTRRVSEAAQGTGEAKDAIRELGINAAALNQMSPDEQFKEIAQAMAQVNSQQDRVRLGFKLFDSEAVGLVNTLALGADGLRDIEQELEDFGVAISRIDAAMVEAANDEFARARLLTTGFGQQLTVHLAPAVSGIANLFMDSAREAGGLGRVGLAVAEGLVKAFGFVSDVIHGIKVAWKGFVLLFRNGINLLVQQVADWAQRLNEDLGMFGADSQFLRDIGTFADKFQEQTDQFSQDFQDSLLKPMPSSKINAFVDDARKKMRQAAREKAGQDGGGSPLSEVLLPPGLDQITNDPVSRMLRQRRQQAQSDLERLQNDLMSEEERIQASYQRRLEIVQNALDRELVSKQRAAELEKKVERQKDMDILDMRHKLAKAKMQVAKDVLSVGIAIAKEDSKAQRALLAIQKAIAVRESLIQLQAAMAKALNTPYPANLAAIATVASTGASIISTLKGVSTDVPSFLGGGFTGSGPRVGGVDGKGGFMSVVHPDERIIDQRSGGGGEPKVEVNLHEDASRPGRVSASQEDDVTRIDVTVASLIDKGESRTTRSLERRYPNNRRQGQ